jgi:hypothetical protein
MHRSAYISIIYRSAPLSFTPSRPTIINPCFCDIDMIVCLSLQDPQGAKAARDSMHGRTFNKHKVAATYYDEAKFATAHYSA